MLSGTSFGHARPRLLVRRCIPNANTQLSGEHFEVSGITAIARRKKTWWFLKKVAPPRPQLEWGCQLLDDNVKSSSSIADGNDSCVLSRPMPPRCLSASLCVAYANRRLVTSQPCDTKQNWRLECIVSAPERRCPLRRNDGPTPYAGSATRPGCASRPSAIPPSLLPLWRRVELQAQASVALPSLALPTSDRSRISSFTQILRFLARVATRS